MQHPDTYFYSRKFLLLASSLLLLSLPALAQDVFLKSGINATTYDFREKGGVRITNFLPATGASYELGIDLPFRTFEDSTFLFAKQVKNQVSFTLEELNGISGSKTTSYRSETRFAGLSNRISVLGVAGPLEIGLTGVFGASTLLSGVETLNNSVVDLRKAPEFNGLFLRTGLGVTTAYLRPNNARFSLSYEYVSQSRLSRKFDDRLRFLTHNILFGVHLPLN